MQFNPRLNPFSGNQTVYSAPETGFAGSYYIPLASFGKVFLSGACKYRDESLNVKTVAKKPFITKRGNLENTKKTFTARPSKRDSKRVVKLSFSSFVLSIFRVFVIDLSPCLLLYSFHIQFNCFHVVGKSSVQNQGGIRIPVLAALKAP